MHLTGIAPIKDDQTPEQTLLDFVEGRGEFDNIMIANRGAAFEKLQVLPDFEAIIDAGSFYLMIYLKLKNSIVLIYLKQLCLTIRICCLH